LAIEEENAVAGQFAETHFRAGEIRQDSDRLSYLGRNGTNPVVSLEGQIQRLVRKIYPSNIHARLNETLEDTRIVRGWAD
jgi:HD superfamily phosphodiesterase